MQIHEELRYVGFWRRTGAYLIDGLLYGALALPVLTVWYGSDYWTSGALIMGPLDFLMSWVLPAVAVLLFWAKKQATPGKMVFQARLVDARTGQPPRLAQYVGRYLAYFLSALPLGAGYIWIAFDRRKRGWHDMLAGTVVVRPNRTGPEAVAFDSA